MADLSRFYRFIAISLFIVFSNYSNAQTSSYKISAFKIYISGTTNMHDFESDVTQVNGTLIMDSLFNVKTLTIDIPVSSIKSGNSIMDKKTYNTFDAEKNPQINFALTNLDFNNRSPYKLLIKTHGNLSMGGTKKAIYLTAKGKMLSKNKFNVEGKVVLKMTDFGMTPPTWLIGLMKVGDEITVNYNVTFTE